MKQAKQIFAVMLALLLLCTLTACGDKMNANADDHSDWVWVRKDLTYGALSDAGYYYIDDHSLRYFDFGVNSSTVLCTKAGCGHGTQGCDAYISGFGVIPMFFGNDHLYYCPSSAPEVYSRNTVGMELKKVGNLAVKYTQEQKVAEISACAVADGYLYYTATVLERVQENGSIAIKTGTLSIGRLNLSTGKDEILIEEAIDQNGENLTLCAVRENGVLFSHTEGTHLERSDPNYTKALQSVPVTLEHWNAETGEITELFRKSRKDCTRFNMVADGKVFFSVKFGEPNGKLDYNYTNFYDLRTGKEGVACEAYTKALVGGAYAMCADKDSEELFIYNMDRKQRLPYTLDKTVNLHILNTSDKGLIARIFIEAGKNEDGTSTSDQYYYYISHKALADGLQEEDLLHVYTIWSSVSALT